MVGVSSPLFQGRVLVAGIHSARIAAGGGMSMLKSLHVKRIAFTITLTVWSCILACNPAAANECVTVGPANSTGVAFAAPAYTPVTFTQLSWRYLGAGLLYSRWNYAFKNFSFYGRVRQGWLYAGHRLTISCEGSRSGITNLIRWFPQTGMARSLSMTQDFVTPAPLPPDAGSLAGEVVALTLNIAFNDTRVMPRHPGYDLENFTIRQGAMRGRTVGYVCDVANRVLGGDSPLRYGFPNHQALVDVLKAINSNYEFRGYLVCIDRGYLVPNRPLGPPDPPHDPHIP